MNENQIIKIDGLTVGESPASLTEHKLDESQVPIILAGTKGEKTIAIYQAEFAAYVDYCNQHGLDWGEATSLAAYRTHLWNGNRKLGVRSINKKLSAIRSVMTSAADFGYVSYPEAGRQRANSRP